MNALSGSSRVQGQPGSPLPVRRQALVPRILERPPAFSVAPTEQRSSYAGFTSTAARPQTPCTREAPSSRISSSEAPVRGRGLGLGATARLLLSRSGGTATRSLKVRASIRTLECARCNGFRWKYLRRAPSRARRTRCRLAAVGRSRRTDEPFPLNWLALNSAIVARKPLARSKTALTASVRPEHTFVTAEAKDSAARPVKMLRHRSERPSESMRFAKSKALVMTLVVLAGFGVVGSVVALAAQSAATPLEIVLEARHQAVAVSNEFPRGIQQ